MADKKSFFPEVARLLGVEVGEVFNIDFLGATRMDYRFTESDFEVLDDAGWRSGNYRNLHYLLDGTRKIIKKPWKPNFGDMYWYVTVTGDANSFVWRGDSEDLILYRLGNCYRNEESAKADSKRWKDFYGDNSLIHWEKKENLF